jgi:hypothetical protein
VRASPPCRKNVGEFGAGGRKVHLRNKQLRSERLELAGVAIGCGSGLVATLGRKQGHHGTAAAATSRKYYELF